MRSMLDADRLTPTEVAKRLKVHVGTIWRWLTTGVKGRVLPSTMFGGRRYILLADLEQFLAAGLAGRSVAPISMERRAAEAAKLLDAAGIKGH